MCGDRAALFPLHACFGATDLVFVRHESDQPGDGALDLAATVSVAAGRGVAVEAEARTTVWGRNTLSGTRWSLDISHGEPLRAGVDQTLSLSLCHLRYVYDGHDPTARGPYSTLPWQLGLLTQTNSTC